VISRETAIYGKVVCYCHFSTGQTTEYGEKIMPPLQAMHKHRNYLHQGP